MLENEADAVCDRHAGRIEHDRVLCGPERGCRPARIARVAFPDVVQKTINGNRVSFFYQLLISALRTLLGAGRDVDLERGVGEDDGAHVAAVRDEPGRPPEPALASEQRPPHAGKD